MSEESKAITKATIDSASEMIEKVSKACDVVKLSHMSQLEQAVTLGRGIAALKRVFTQELVNEVFMPLQGSTLGFVTDKDKDGGYSDIVVRNVWIQGSIWGLAPVNNELNIIAERAYAAKNGLERKVREATRGLVIRPGVPVANGDKTALLAIRATWTIDGKVFELVKDLGKINGEPFDERYAIRVNNGMGPDAVIGKGLRKMYRDILQVITNGSLGIECGDVLDADGVVVSESKPVAPPEQDGKRMHLGNKKPETKTAPSPEPDRGDDPNNY